MTQPWDNLPMVDPDASANLLAFLIGLIVGAGGTQAVRWLTRDGR